MLARSDVPIEQFVLFFANTNVPVAFLVPTPTGYHKSIMDATAPVRQLLYDMHIHDYETQPQGQDYKVYVPTYLVTPEGLEETMTSLYRPETKQGDPRIWIYKLQHYCVPDNLLALTVSDGCIYVYNLSNPEISDSLFNGGFCYEILTEATAEIDQIADELLQRIQEIHDAGFLRSITAGDPGVGDTLENALGIMRNNEQTPDYHGIELKSSRTTIHTPTRNTLFTQVPDWSIAMSERQILDTFGYIGTDHTGTIERLQLYCTITSRATNPQGLFLYYNERNDFVEVIDDRPDIGRRRVVTAWHMQLLRDRLLEKHPATFWVKATTRIQDGWEYFRYDHIKYTRNPNVYLFASLIEQGVVTVDFLVHEKPNGSIRNHGYPFKIMPANIDLLFPQAIEYDLTR